MVGEGLWGVLHGQWLSVCVMHWWGVWVSGWWSGQLAACWLARGCCRLVWSSGSRHWPCQPPLRSSLSTTLDTVSRVKLGKQWETRTHSDCHPNNHLMRLLVTPHCHDQTRMHQHQTRNDKVFLSTCIKYFRWAGMSGCLSWLSGCCATLHK